MAGGDPRLARALLAALMSMRGTIFLYQGDELGLPDGQVPFERLQDPFAIAAYAGGPGRDGARTPMPWTDAAPMGGFTSAPDAWLPMDQAHLPLSIARQEADARSMLHFTRALTAARRGSEAMRTGDAAMLTTPEGVLGFERVAVTERVRCYFELAGAAVVIPGEDLARGHPLLLEGGASLTQAGLDLPPFAVALVRL
jgi:alpha-glucosidase